MATPILTSIDPLFEAMMRDNSIHEKTSLDEGIESKNNYHDNNSPNSGPIEDVESRYPGPLGFALLLPGVCLAAFIVALGRSIVATVIPQITEHFGSPEDVGWYGSAYLLTACAFQPLFGRVYTHFNIRNAYLLSLRVFEFGSLLCGVERNSTALIVGRAISGVGEAGIIAGNLNIISLGAPLKKRPLVRFAFGIGFVCGPIIGGTLISRVSWRWCFCFNLPVGAVTLVALLCFFHPKKSLRACEQLKKRLLHLDLVVNILTMAAVIMLLLALQWGGFSMPWSSSRIIGLVVGFGVVSILFLIWQWYYGTEALLPLRMITQRNVFAAIASSFFQSGAVLVYTHYLPYWFQAIKNASPLRSGIDTIPYVASSFVAAICGAIMVKKSGYLNIPSLAGSIIASVGVGLLYTLHEYTPTARWVGFEILGTAKAATLITEEVLIGTALILFSQNLSGAIFVSVESSILRNKLLVGFHDPQFAGVNIQLQPLLTLYNSALQNVFIMAVPMSVLVLICAIPLEWRDLREKQREQSQADI
ncbi:putative major facilitator superfamily transporter protein [Botrytis fragariae]|uniref:Putative major facilitator superfamily transporter protein n=1 Tax=Botrytis fragariae TaxID=1964551 RepID=A0A8H6EJE8_9HELO|nr:putative major facilitator superfamily transporter protein [Botrytis fragariae]KAF5874080.1 putative major facilitator superfamily transporter protein [Botrytis fragariae]